MHIGHLIELVALGTLGVALYVFFEGGRRFGRAFRRRKGEPRGIEVINASLFALMGLLIGFSFSGASSRFDARRKLIVDEANFVGTAYLRIDLVPVAAQPSLRQDFRRYLDTRLAFYRSLDAGNETMARRRLAEYSLIQDRIWKAGVEASLHSDTPVTGMLFLASLNEMIDVSAERVAVLFFHPPLAVFAMLIGVAFVCCLSAGFELSGGEQVSGMHVLGFVAVLALTLGVILDLEFPRFGFIRVEGTDEILVRVREGMN